MILSYSLLILVGVALTLSMQSFYKGYKGLKRTNDIRKQYDMLRRSR